MRRCNRGGDLSGRSTIWLLLSCAVLTGSALDIWQVLGLYASSADTSSASGKSSGKSSASGKLPGKSSGKPSATSREERARDIDCSKSRLVYIDMGVNWANTLRLYKDINVCPNAPQWEIYGFEAVPLIQPYANHFVEYLNGQVPAPPRTLPPTGSSEDLAIFGGKYNCTGYNPLAREFKDCMFSRLEDELMKLEPNDRLGSEHTITERLHVASKRNRSPWPRYTFIPAAVGAATKRITMSTSRIGVVRGGGTEAALSSRFRRGKKSQDTAKAWKVIDYDVLQVDSAKWIATHFSEDDFVFVKSDCEGAEHFIVKELIRLEKLCLIDVLAWQCHDLPATPGTREHDINCLQTRALIKQTCPNIRIIEEGPGVYDGFDASTRAELANELGMSWTGLRQKARGSG